MHVVAQRDAGMAVEDAGEARAHRGPSSMPGLPASMSSRTPESYSFATIAITRSSGISPSSGHQKAMPRPTE